MPKLPALTSQAVISVLEQRGFKLRRSKGSHQIYFHPASRRRVTVPFHRGPLPVGTLRSILREAGIEPDELREML
ncbi:MAG: type II toxin-antitoxin system HicA family toxin [Chloroflexi bacterium]|nr:type II toxin-antitoxin system HicA family toxin [Chloroflexota bacterium]